MAATTSHHPQPLRPSTANPGLKKPAHHPPTTPLRRISRGSLSALSASRSREVEDGAEPLEHLFHVFAELSEGFEDLAVNFEALNAVCESLDSFNEGFASFLYGLRVNAYTTEFVDAPSIANFELASRRAAAQKLKEEEEQRALEEASRRSPSPTPSSSAQTDVSAFTEGDTTVLGARGGTVASKRGTGRGAAVAGRGGSRIAGQPAGKSAAQKKKEAMIKFAQPIIATLPIQYREQQPSRGDVEVVIGALRQHPDGLRIPDMVKMFPTIPQHRINDSLLALVRAKHAIKLTQKGLIYRLDPLKYPAA